ncbi:MAG: tetrathionate reductase family octaheme c-type cytochrome [Chlorobium sp.]|nr:tetrathionate reductase family octaheme c-type cytochrome [Chlorobium phaeovibrioides]NQU45517.1 tetrathionate reductase family octaheme c-type cytochrome [Chlorobium sp.]
MHKLLMTRFIPVLLFLLITSTATAEVYHHPVDKITKSTADHTKFPQLKKNFKSGPEVTKACLECHTEASRQIHRTKHWTWEVPMKDGKMLGKQHVVNNFCISVEGNEPRCTSCHIGYGWKDKKFDFASQENVDCLACHDGTGTYQKLPAGAGHPAYQTTTQEKKTYKKVDLSHIAQHVQNPDRHNCGSCHFEGGGADAVKHGDLDNTLLKPDHSLDVHMASGKGELNMTCTDCHKTEGHQVPGSRYEPTAYDRHGFDYPLPDDFPTTCSSCHGNAPHSANKKLNDHIDKVACQTCHIPQIAKQRATKMWWDWSKAGKFDDKGKMIVKKDSTGHPTYLTKKGEFRWEKNMPPEYRWFNGQMNYTTFLTTFDDRGIVQINHPDGKAGDPQSRIWPFKVHRGKQPYDTQLKRFVKPKLYGPKGSGAYWSDFSWDKSITAGMENAGLKYSGKYDFIETEMYWPISHMVSPKEEAMGCVECHARGGRLESLGGFYLPGRDVNPFVEIIGFIVIAGTLLGVIGHSIKRYTTQKNMEQEDAG